MLAQDFNISREKMDELALISHTRASEAQQAGLFKKEIMPIETTVIDESGVVKHVVVDKDDGLRHGTTLERLAGAKSAFPQWGGGVSTGGNSSQVSMLQLYW